MHITGFLEVAGGHESLFLNLLNFLLHNEGILVKYMVILQNNYSSIIAIPMILPSLDIKHISILLVAKLNTDYYNNYFCTQQLGFSPPFNSCRRKILSVKSKIFFIILMTAWLYRTWSVFFYQVGSTLNLLDNDMSVVIFDELLKNTK